MSYFLYTYLIYCFNIHFNNLFLFYCAILGLSFYSFFYYFYITVAKPVIEITNPTLKKITGIYLLFTSCLFYFLWLSEIVPAIETNATPKSIKEAGLFSNPVQIIDLSILLPGVLATGILLLFNRKIAFHFTPILLTFFILMDLTICLLI